MCWASRSTCRSPSRAPVTAARCGQYGNVKDAADALVHISRTIEPDAELTARYEERYQKFRQIYPSCKALFRALAD